MDGGKFKKIFGCIFLIAAFASIITGIIWADIEKSKEKEDYSKLVHGSIEDYNIYRDYNNEDTGEAEAFDKTWEIDELDHSHDDNINVDEDGYLNDSVVDYGLRQGWTVEEIQNIFNGEIDPDKLLEIQEKEAKEQKKQEQEQESEDSKAIENGVDHLNKIDEHITNGSESESEEDLGDETMENTDDNTD